MKKVLALLLAFTLVMPMFAVTALAGTVFSPNGTVDVIYNKPDNTHKLSVLEVSFDASAVAVDADAQYSIQAYLTAEAVDTADKRLAAGITADNTTWISQAAGADLAVAKTFLLGEIPAIAAVGNTVSVWVNDKFIGGDKITLDTYLSERSFLSGDNAVAIVENFDTTPDFSYKINFAYALAESTELKWLYNSGTYVSSQSGEMIGLWYFDEIQATILKTEAPGSLIYGESQFDIYARIDGTEHVVKLGTWTLGEGTPVADATEIWLADSMLKGLKATSNGPIALLGDPAGSDVQKANIVSLNTAVLTVARNDNKEGIWYYKAIKSGTAIVKVSVGDVVTDMASVRVIP